MNLIQLIQKEIKTNEILMVILFFVGGFAEISILILIISYFSSLSQSGIHYHFIIGYLCVLSLYILCKRFVLRRTLWLLLTAIKLLTQRVVNKIRQSELYFIEHTGHETLYKQLTQNTERLSEAFVIVMNAFHSSIMIVFGFLYTWFISKEAFIIALGILTFSFIFFFTFINNEYSQVLSKKNQQETLFLNVFNQLLIGFKELKQNSRMSHDHFAYLLNVLSQLKRLNNQENKKAVSIYVIFFNIIYISFLGIITFIIPKISNAGSDVVLKVIMAGIFSAGPINVIFEGIPLLIQINQIIDRLYALEKKLMDQGVNSEQNILPTNMFDQFQYIHMKQLIFNHYDINNKVSFTLGPFDMHVNRGEVIFIVGGNGCGKTTLMKLFCGLYHPKSGSLKIDGVPVSESLLPSYRNLFSCIMNDYYLFDQLYGLDHMDEETVYDWLKKMRLEKKTNIINNRFTNINLSSGQKKRLAMIVSQLQDKPIYIFDEWASDQDETFRKVYYESLLKEMKNKGKTIIAVSHDDRFFHVADRVIKIEYGQERDSN